MPYSITQLKADVSGTLHGTTVNQVKNFYGLLYRAASSLQSDIDVEECRRTVALSTPVYGEVYDYACPSDLKGNRVIDLRPYVGRSVSDRLFQQYSQEFDRTKSIISSGIGRIETRWNTGVKTLRIGIPNDGNVLLDACGVDDDWSVGGGASGLEEDSQVYAYGSASLKYSLLGSGYVANSSISADLSDMEGEGVVFAYVWSPSTVPNGHTLRIGTDASNYYEVSVTAPWDITAYREGWNLLGFDLSSATTTGSPDISDIQYVYLYTDQTGTATPVRLGVLFASLGKILEIEYYSKYLFRDTTGSFKERPTADSDLINLDTDTYMAYFNKVMELCSQQVQGEDGMNDYTVFASQYRNEIEMYRRKYPSQVQKPQSSYYAVVKRSPSRLAGGRFR